MGTVKLVQARQTFGAQRASIDAAIGVTLYADRLPVSELDQYPAPSMIHAATASDDLVGNWHFGSHAPLFHFNRAQ
jgi:hypothetical protein